MSDTPISPNVGSVSLAGVAPTVTKPTVTSMVPTVAALALAGVAPSLSVVLNPTVVSDGPNSGSYTHTWPALGNGAAGGQSPVGSPPLSYSSAFFVATGTIGAAGSVQLEGSADGLSWMKLSPAALTSLPGAFASLGAQERPRFIRPHVTNGDGTTAITVSGTFRA